MAQLGLFGEVVPDPPADYHITYDPDEKGCADCAHADRAKEKCRLGRAMAVDMDYGTCGRFRQREG